ncbi:glycosyltransferase, partial [Paenibacillus sepulcri]|nr:glycosyltransferase [Paenibacillus sepulcri]
MSPAAATASVCIVTYNSASDIQRCIQAVLQQSHPVAGIVVVDNASTDNTCDIVRGFQESTVRLVANRDNVGFAAGQNQAIRQTDSDYVLVLNPDVELGTDYIACIVEFMEQHPEV